MIAETFTAEAPGSLVDITDALGNKGLAFMPSLLPPTFEPNSRAIRAALSRADQELARLDGVARQIQKPEMLFANYLNREALFSSKIEGTRTTLADLALFDLAGRTENDASAVANYVDAYNYSRQRCREVPISVNLLCDVHAILMHGTDPAKTAPGLLRDRAVLIGNAPLSAARFVPPPSLFVNELMEDLERYLAHDQEPPLIKLAMAHYQFETIHPFCDGNGRVGRIMISAWLEQEQILTAPMLYISAFFQQHQQRYYDALLRVSTHGAWEEWILFFLEAVATQSRDAIRRTSALAALRDRYHQMVSTRSRSHNIHDLVESLFATPLMSVPYAKQVLGLTYAAAKPHVMRLVDLGILGEPVQFGGVAYYFPLELIAMVEGPISD